MALQSVTSSGRQPSLSRSVGSAPDCSSSSTMSENSQAEAVGRDGERAGLGLGHGLLAGPDRCLFGFKDSSGPFTI